MAESQIRTCKLCGAVLGNVNGRGLCYMCLARCLATQKERNIFEPQNTMFGTFNTDDGLYIIYIWYHAHDALVKIVTTPKTNVPHHLCLAQWFPHKQIQL